MSALTYITKVLAYDDLPKTNNPRRVGIDRTVSLVNIPVENDQTAKFDLDPGASVVAIDGTRSTAQDGTTAYTLTLHPFDPTTYRLTYVSGTAPAFRTDRGLNLETVALTLTVNPNQTLTIEAATGTPFSAVQSGDVVFIPGVSTGDAPSQFNPLNEGSWYCLATGGATIVVGRAPGTVFSGSSDSVTPTTTNAIQAFSATGVQVGDTVDISAGFAQNTQRSYEITAVNPFYIEFISTLPLGLESAIEPGVDGLVIYTAAKRFIGIECEEEIVVQYNGDTGNTNRVTPLLAGSRKFTGSALKWGTTWKLVLVNRTQLRHTVTVYSAE
jgi:hypothetical protein